MYKQDIVDINELLIIQYVTVILLLLYMVYKNHYNILKLKY